MCVRPPDADPNENTRPKLVQHDGQPTGDQRALGRFPGITRVYTTGANKGACPIVIDIAPSTLKRLYVGPHPPEADPNKKHGQRLGQSYRQATRDLLALCRLRGLTRFCPTFKPTTRKVVFGG
ncbi:hypothetical protein DPMN_137147 [Dreissena polymorpha]|uniref:Uncharacterized protein n=1 Tax=Dreissena polymorpha TaxID=45954 RepID=A0A9D4JHE5_DREPO|nr:hypothetical protein DPMN_137147 [Dreissena polymorpha]